LTTIQAKIFPFLSSSGSVLAWAYHFAVYGGRYLVLWDILRKLILAKSLSTNWIEGWL